ncbi:MAG TPA: leucine-rich repeat protein [Bacillales bacterium]|nr:leucine-rich repeat protein [Bacillales bacterium]
MRGGIRFGLFSLLLFLTIISVGHNAYANEAYYEWIENEDGTVTITKYKGLTKDLIIPNQLNNKDVTAIGDEAFYYKSLTSVKLPDTIITIGDWAFGNNKLTSIELPDSLIHIGMYGFIHNSLLTLIIPDHVSNIGFQAFGYNQLTNITLPNGITSVGHWSFAHNQIASLTIPDSMTQIDQYAFAYNNLTAVTLPKSVIKIDDYAFTGNPQLSEARILSSATQLSSVSFPNIGSQLTIYGHANSTAQLHVLYNSRYKGYKFEPFTNRVVYNGNGHSVGNVPIDDNLYVRWEKATVLGNTGLLERPGYRFDGWNSAADGSGEDYAVNSKVTIGEEDVVLFAKWVPEDARAPVITDASTAEDTQSTSGLIITPHPEEPGNVMHYKISAIVGGTLYKNNGMIQIHSGDFITTAEGGAGLKFTPEADANSPAGDVFSFQVQAAHDNAEAGLSPPAHASITVSEVNDPPVAVNDTLPKVAKAGDKVVIAFADLLMNDSAGPANESSQSLTIINVDNAVGGTVAIVNGQIEFDLDPTFAGTARFFYTVQDNGTTNGIDDFKTASAIVSFEVNPKPTEPLEVSIVEPLDDIEVSYGTERSALPLPPTVQVTLSDQSIRSLVVTWDNGNPAYDGNTDGEYTFTGTLAQDQDVANPQNLTAQVKVVVNPKLTEPLEVSIVESLDDINVSYGTERSALPLPLTVQVTLSDQTTRNLGVTWDEGSPAYNGNTAGEYTFTGTLAQDVANPQNLKAQVKVVVKAKPTEPDKESPIWPNGSKLTVSDITKTSVKLSWPEAQDTNGVIGYRIYVDNREPQTVTGSVYEQIVTGLTAGTAYTFTIKAFNAAGNESEPLSAKATTAQSSSGGGGSSGGGSGSGRVLSSNADLADLQVWVGDKKLKLSSSFASGTTDYKARTEAEQIEIVAKEAHSKAKVILKDKVITDRTKVNLDEGDNTFVLTVQAENGMKKKYTLAIYRETPKRSEPVIEFTDIASHWAENNIKRAAAKGIVSGYPDGTFKPNHPVTRAEFTVMLTGALQLEEEGATLTFTDQDQIGIWAKQTVAKAVKAGIVGGYGDGGFRPNAQITRVEMAVMIARAHKLELESNTVTGFADDEAIPKWAKGSVEAIRELGITSGREGNKFVPDDKATRAEAATILFRMLDIQK